MLLCLECCGETKRTATTHLISTIIIDHSPKSLPLLFVLDSEERTVPMMSSTVIAVITTGEDIDDVLIPSEFVAVTDTITVPMYGIVMFVTVFDVFVDN